MKDASFNGGGSSRILSVGEEMWIGMGWKKDGGMDAE